MKKDSPDSGHVKHATIEVRVRDLQQLFDSLDPSPFHEKDLDRNAEEYIVSSARELNHRVPAALLVYLDQPAGLPDEERIVGDAIRIHFVRRAQLSRWQLHRLLRNGWISLMIGLSFLAASIIGGEYLARVVGPGHLTQVLGQSLLIGGWVAMWRPLEIFLYDWWALVGERRVYERLGRMAVRIVYQNASRKEVPMTTTALHST